MITINTHQRWLAAVILSGGLLTGGLMSASPGLAGQAAATPSAGSAIAATPGTDRSQCDDTDGAGGQDDATDATDAIGQQDQDGTAEQENDGGDDATEGESADPAATPEQEDDDDDDATEGESGADNGQDDNSGDAAATPGALAGGQDLLTQATISLDDATIAAQAAAQGPLGDVELEDMDGTLTFRVEIGEQDVLIDAADGTVISVAPGDGTDDTGDDCADDDAAEVNAAPGTLVEGQDLALQATITIDEAVSAAQATVSGDLGVVGLEDQDGRLVYTVKIGDQEVTVDAATGEVIGTESNQEG